MTELQTDKESKTLDKMSEHWLEMLNHSGSGETLSEFHARSKLDKERRAYLEDLKQKALVQVQEAQVQVQDIQQVQEREIV
jgi:hypothetical protein